MSAKYYVVYNRIEKKSEIIISDKIPSTSKYSGYDGPFETKTEAQKIILERKKIVSEYKRKERIEKQKKAKQEYIDEQTRKLPHYQIYNLKTRLWEKHDKFTGNIVSKKKYMYLGLPVYERDTGYHPKYPERKKGLYEGD